MFRYGAGQHRVVLSNCIYILRNIDSIAICKPRQDFVDQRFDGSRTPLLFVRVCPAVHSCHLNHLRHGLFDIWHMVRGNT